MPLAPLNILTLQRQIVFACPWVCGQTLQSVVSMSLACQNIFLPTVSSISFLLCLPKLSMRNQGVSYLTPPFWVFTHLSSLSAIQRYVSWWAVLFCLLMSLAVCCWIFSLRILSELWPQQFFIYNAQLACSLFLLLLLWKASFILPCFPEKCWKYMTGIKFSFFT